MPLFKIKENKATKLDAVKPDGLKNIKEKDIQKLFEDNLEVILNIYFLASEYSTSFGGRIDTLGIDKTGSPVIIEYKRNQNDNIINQGLSYLRWLLDHKEKFERLVESKSSDVHSPAMMLYWQAQAGIGKFIDWNSSRVICIAESYNRFDLDTVEMLPIKIELLRYKLYEDNILQIETETQSKVKISTSKITKERKKETLQRDYYIEDHLKAANKAIKELYLDLREKIKGLDETIAEEPKGHYIAYKLTTNFVDIIIQRNSLKISLNMPSGKLNDPYNLARDLTKPKPVGHLGNGDYEVKLSKKEDLEKAFELIKQSYNYNK